MKWSEYKQNFIKECKISNKTDEFIEDKLKYAKKLFKQNLPVIYDEEHLSLLIGYNLEYLYKVSNSQKNFYRTFEILKKNSKVRVINEPLPNLKEIQHWILENILYKLPINPYIKSYIKGRTIKDNAKFHRDQKVLLTLDVKNYFPSISSNKVFKFFLKLGYNKTVTLFLTNLCVLNKSIPQGSPTSPMLSNLLTQNIDNRISKFSKKIGIRYTRYADDLTFSGDFNPGKVIRIVGNILEDEGFKINPDKTRTRRKNQRQEVTGIVVNKKMQVNNTLRRRIRQEIYYIDKNGLESHLERINESENLNYIEKLIGLNEFVLFVNPKDENSIKNRRKLMEFKNK